MTWELPRQVHTSAIGVLFQSRPDGPHILVIGGHNDLRNEDYFRPLEAEVASGEDAGVTLARFIHQKFGLDVATGEPLGELRTTLHGIGETVEKVTYVFRCALRSAPLPELDEVPQLKATDIVATWQPLADFVEEESLLLPTGLLALLLRR